MSQYETKKQLLIEFTKIPQEQQSKINHIKNWTQKLPPGFRSKNNYKLENNCFVCSTTEKLQPHHITYTPIEDYITVCNRCHSFIHEKHIRYKDTKRDKELRQQSYNRIYHPTIEDKRYRFKYTTRCRLGTCRKCSINCKVRKDYIDVIKTDILTKRTQLKRGCTDEL
jgi:hypothetical protein